MTNWNHIRGGAAAIVMAAAITPAALAQQTTSEIRGVVTNESGAPLPNASVTIVDTRTNQTRTVNTGNQGFFSARNLTVGGPYTVTVTAPNVQGQTIENVFANVGGRANLNFELASVSDSRTLDTIVVTASQVNLQQLAIGPNAQFNLEDLENFVSIDRDIRDIIRFDPRVVVEDDNISCLGGGERSNSFTIDGIRSGDAFGLNSSGFPNRNSLPLPFDAVRETSVEFAPFDVEYSQFTGCNINIVTKSGTNDFEAETFLVYNSDELSGGTGSADFNNFNWGASVGGPIIKDKLFFYAAYEEVRDSGGVVGTGPSGSGFVNEVPFITIDQFNAIGDVLNAQFGRDTLGLGTGTSETNRRILGRFDWIINDDHRLEFNYNRLREEDTNPDDVFGNLISFADNFEIEGSELDSYSARLFSQWTDNLSTELRASRADVQDVQNPLGGGEAGPGVAGIPRIVVGSSNDVNGDGVIGFAEGGFVVSGPGQFRSANSLATQVDQIEFRADYVLNNHTISVGYELDQLDVFNLFVPNATGTIIFSDIDALIAGQANPAVPDEDGDFVDTASPAFDFLNLENLVGIIGNGSFSGDIGDAAASFSRSIHSVYIQDEWQPTDRLTLILGLRYDFFNSSDTPIANPVFEERFGFSNATFVDDIDIFLPRFGLTWDAPEGLFGDTVFTLGAGVFTGGDPTVFFSNAFSNFGGSFDEGQSVLSPCTDADLQVIDAAGNFTGIPQCVIDQQQLGAGAFLGRTDAIDPNIDIPSVVRASFGFDHNTDFGGFAGGFFDAWNVSINVIHSRNRNTFQFADITLTEIGTAPDGRPIFNAIDPLLPGCDAVFNGIGTFGFSGPADQLAPGGACDAGSDDQDILLTNFDGDNGGATTLSAQFGKTWDYSLPVVNKPGSFDFRLGYAYSVARDRVGSLSSTATSNFEETATENFNDPALAPNRFVNNHNVTLTASFEQEFISDLSTRFSLFFNASSGDRFAFAFDAGTSALTFGDSDFEARSLLYVPTGPTDPLFSPDSFGGDAAAQAEFFAFLDESGLDEFAGGIAPRGSFRDPFFLDLDIRLQQELPSLWEGQRTLFFVDIENLPNLIDGGTNLRRSFDRGDVAEAVPVASADIENGQFVFDDFAFEGGTFPDFDIINGSSLWEIQFGLRLEF